MAKLRFDIEQWGAILSELEQIRPDARRPCVQQAMDEIRALLVDVERARERAGDKRSTFNHDCEEAQCATVAAEREARDDAETTLGLRVLEAEFGAFFVVVPMADGKLATLALPDDDGVLARNVVKAAQGWAKGEAESKS